MAYTLNDIIQKTVVCLGMEDKPMHTVDLFTVKDEETNNLSAFMTFSHLENNDGLDFGDVIGNSEQDPENIIAAVYFANERSWNNFVSWVNRCDKRFQEIREKINEGLQD